ERVAVEDFLSAPRAAAEQIAEHLVPGHGDHADLLDFQAAGDVRQANGRVVVGSTSQGHAENAHDHVAGAGDVVDLPGPGRKQLPPAVAMHQGHAVFVEGNDGRLQIELFLELS